MAVTRTCSTSPTRTLYRVETAVRATQTLFVPELVPIAPRIVTNWVVTSQCNDRRCWPVTTPVRTPMPGSSATRTRTVYRGNSGTTTRRIPTATLYGTSCSTTTVIPATRTTLFPGSSKATTIPPGSGSFDSSTLTDTSSRTLATGIDINNPDGSNSPRRLNIGAVVGGLLGGFLTPILLVFLVRYLIKRRRRTRGRSGLTSPTPTMRSIYSGGGFPPLYQRPLSPATTLYRSPTTSDHGHYGSFNPFDPQNLDRRISKTSRMSRASHDRRGGAPSPASSSHGHESQTHHVVRRPSMVHYAAQPHPPVAFNGGRAASPVAPNMRSPSPVQAYGGAMFVSPYESRRAASPAAIRDYGQYSHPQGAPVSPYDFRGGGPSPITSPVATPQQETPPHAGDGYVVGAPLPSVDEHAPLSPPSEGNLTTSSARTAVHFHPMTAPSSVQSHSPDDPTSSTNVNDSERTKARTRTPPSQ